MSVQARPETSQAITALAPPSAGSLAAKRIFDVLGAVILLVLAAPLLALIAAIIRIESGGSPVFSQVRVGRNGRRFKVRKFRTMVSDAESQREALKARSADPDWLLLERDPRITSVGHVFRVTSLDELPQLWNVIRGEMSLVGPRPLDEDDDARVPTWAQVRNQVPPGITGLWQVSGRTNISFQDMLRLDCEYAANRSFWRDIVLILRTVPAVLFARGVN
jgi:lipopolysaccharide/colanic/teichoic acid biosynthesis glycosyltransferase